MHVCLCVPVWRVYMRVSTAGIAPVEAAAALLMALSSGQKVPASAADFATFGLKNAYINGGGSWIFSVFDIRSEQETIL